MHIQRLIVGPLNTNCYIVSPSPAADTAVIIDPGADGDLIHAALNGRKITAILLTHGHYDHTGALKDFPQTPIYMHESEAAFMADPHCATGGGDPRQYESRPSPTHLLKDGDTLSLPGSDTPVCVIHTPGHTPGCVVYCFDRHYFTGDTLFRHGYGRYDLPGGDLRQLMGSLRRLLKSPEDAAIYPGHGESSTLFQERGK